jgi:type VI secretion system protein ImpA
MRRRRSAGADGCSWDHQPLESRVSLDIALGPGLASFATRTNKDTPIRAVLPPPGRDKRFGGKGRTRVIDPAKFTTALSDGGPSGPNLEYDPNFMALDRAQQARPEQVIGDSVKPAQEPDWRDVTERAEALMGRTRDLRVAVALTHALLRTEGLQGFSAGLSVIKGLLEGQWDSVHPQLDPDDNNDPTLRVNSLLNLAAGDGVLKSLREVPLVASKTLGRFSLRDIRIASGKQPAPANLAEPPKQVQIDAAFRDADLNELQASATQVAASLDNLASVDKLLVDKVGSQAPELKPLVLDLTEIKHVLAEQLSARGVGVPGTEAAGGAEGGKGGGKGEIESREDVARQLDRLCEYYRRHEPSSPVPMLLRRAKRLVSKDFMEIVRDLTPGGVAEAELLGGIEKASE